MVCKKGIVDVWPNRLFFYLVTSFEEVLRRITKGQVVASEIQPPTQVVYTTVTLASLLEDEETQRSKRMKHLQFYTPLQQETTLEEKSPTVDHLTLRHLPEKEAVEVVCMLKQIASM